MNTETPTAEYGTAGLLSLDYVVIILATISGVIHLYEGYEDLGEGVIGILFILAGIGFFAWIALLVIGFRLRVLYPVGFVFTAIQFVLYFVLNWPEIYESLGLIDKAVQLALMIVLLLVYRRRF